MRNSNKVTTILTVDGQVLQMNPDGTYKPLASQTDWNRVNNMSDEELTAIAHTDPDNPEWTEEAWSKLSNLKKQPRKQSIHIKVDEDILHWFKSSGRGYQTRINAVLRAFVEQNKTAKTPNR